MTCARPGCGKPVALFRGKPLRHCSQDCGRRNSRLTEAQKAEARRLMGEGLCLTEIERDCGISTEALRKLCTLEGIVPPKKQGRRLAPEVVLSPAQRRFRLREIKRRAKALSRAGKLRLIGAWEIADERRAA